MQVPPSLVKRQKTHFHDLPCGASIILGNNGFIWVYPTPEHKEEDAGGFVANLEVREHCGGPRPACPGVLSLHVFQLEWVTSPTGSLAWSWQCWGGVTEGSVLPGPGTGWIGNESLRLQVHLLCS